MNPAVQVDDVVTWVDGDWRDREDTLAAEEPLEIRLAGCSVAVTMRTPGEDFDLAVGFLYTEGIVRSVEDIASIAFCPSDEEAAGIETGVPDARGDVARTSVSATVGDHARNGDGVRGTKVPDTEVRPTDGALGNASGSTADDGFVGVNPGVEREASNIVNVNPADPALVDPKRWRRNFFASSSCGICGKASIEAVRQDVRPIESDARVSADTLLGLDRELRRAQAVFGQTGGLHAAGLFDLDGRLVALREDVGRHNAVDKVVGDALLHGAMPLDHHILMVSGRTSFEIVQKALVAGIPIVAAVSAPSSLAVDLARASNMTLVGFLRSGRFNIYADPERITADRPASVTQYEES